MANLFLGLEQHLTGNAVVLLASGVALLQLALDHWNKHFQRASYLAVGLHRHRFIHVFSIGLGLRLTKPARFNTRRCALTMSVNDRLATGLPSSAALALIIFAIAISSIRNGGGDLFTCSFSHSLQFGAGDM